MDWAEKLTLVLFIATLEAAYASKAGLAMPEIPFWFLYAFAGIFALFFIVMPKKKDDR